MEPSENRTGKKKKRTVLSLMRPFLPHPLHQLNETPPPFFPFGLTKHTCVPAGNHCFRAADFAPRPGPILIGTTALDSMASLDGRAHAQLSTRHRRTAKETLRRLELWRLKGPREAFESLPFCVRTLSPVLRSPKTAKGPSSAIFPDKETEAGTRTSLQGLRTARRGEARRSSAPCRPISLSVD